MKRMLVNATQPEELRVAMVDGQSIYDLDIEPATREQTKANIYKGRITRVEPSLEAAFVDYGAARHGFLPLKEISRSYFSNSPEGNERPKIKDVLKEGQQVIVQVEKEERGNKGAALTTFISLAGRFLVLMPNNPRAGGVSRRIEGEDRDEVRDAIRELNVPDGMGMIIRTAGVGRSAEELQWDLDCLSKLWEAIDDAAKTRDASFLIYQESRLIIRALRDYYNADVGEILVDTDLIYREAHEFMSLVMPQHLSKLKRYEDEVPLFSRFQIESQIQSAYQREVSLPSGGSIVIDHTEALTAIDINSARATKGADIEDTALNTNLEAASEIGRQLRLRDSGGLIVIDFIDMNQQRNQRAVEDRLRGAVRSDRARIQITKISRFGLLEMSRQRLRASLGESSHMVCPRCSGQGTIRTVESLALAAMRLMEEEAMKDNTGRVIAQVPVAVATFLLNEKRAVLSEVESRCGVQMLIVPNKNLVTPHMQIERQRENELDDNIVSHELPTNASVNVTQTKTDKPAPRAEVAAVQSITPNTPPPAPAVKKVPSVGLFAFLVDFFKNIFGGKKKPPQRRNGRNAPQQRRGNNNQRRNNTNQRRSASGNTNTRSGNRQQNNNNPRSRNTNNSGNSDNPEKSANNRNSNRRNNSRTNTPRDTKTDNPATQKTASNRNAETKPNTDNNTQPKTDNNRPAVSGNTASDNASNSETGNNTARRSRRGGRRRRRPNQDGENTNNNNVENTTNTAVAANANLGDIEISPMPINTPESAAQSTPRTAEPPAAEKPRQPRPRKPAAEKTADKTTEPTPKAAKVEVEKAPPKPPKQPKPEPAVAPATQQADKPKPAAPKPKPAAAPAKPEAKPKSNNTNNSDTGNRTPFF